MKRIARLIGALAAGLVFGWGLIVSRMFSPAKVLGFLDVGGAWDPSLAVVMGGAIPVAAIGFALAGRRQRTLLGEPLQLPTARVIDGRLVLGSLAFGVGWGLAGFCPGPAWVAAGTLAPRALVFLAAMLVGMGLFEWLEHLRTSAASAAASSDVLQRQDA